MKLDIFFVLTVAASTISATNPDTTNAHRMARGFPPLPPVRRATPVTAAKRALPSASYNRCDTGSLNCCNSVDTFDSNIATGLSKLLGIDIPIGTSIGLTCSPITLLGIGRSGCNKQTVCCEDNYYDSGISVGCSPVVI